MTLRAKTLIIIGITLLGLTAILHTVLRLVLLDSFGALEDGTVRQNIDRARDALAEETAGLDATARDYAWWDDTCTFIADGNSAYIVSNLGNETFKGLGLNLIAYLDPSGRPVFEKAFDTEKGEEVPVPTSLRQHLAAGSPLLRRGAISGGVSGIVLLPEGPLIVSAWPILTSEGEGPPRGTLIMGRYLTDRVVRRLAQTTHLSLSLKRSGDFQGSLPRAAMAVRPLNNDLIAGYTLINDVYGNPALVLEVRMPRDIHQQGLAGVKTAMAAILATGLVFGAVIILLLEKVVLSRLARLNAGVKSVGGGFAARLPVAGRDEVSNLAAAVNNMMDKLEESLEALRESEGRLRIILDAVQCGVLVIDAGTHVIVDTNRAAEELIGLPRDKIVGAVCHRFVCPHEKGKCPITDLGRTVDHSERELLTADGEPIPVIKTVVRASLGDREHLLESFTDITEQKLMEERLRYLSLHDPLTGFHNRMYFEQEMRRLEAERRAPTGIIVCDVDGLKLVNDSLGHKTGDALLVAAAGIISEACRGHVFARIGGDEFAVILPNRDETAVAGVAQAIREAVVRYNAVHPELPLSMSVGHAVSGEAPVSMDELFREADNNMYREKLHRSRSARSAIVQTLMRALEARDFITEGHAERLQNLVAALAEAAGVPAHRIDDLRLLAQFHDIGKVGIPDRILFKAGPLTPEDTAVMRRHSEIGYHIAQSSSDLAPIADRILKHHEWWNGEGYPLGLKGEDIPLECRILAIVDAYDAMTSDRPYR
ncbi:MAG: CHASE4 domain-containing protein, partial [Thermoanaerobacterales bacterium]|nr:CHASE4 domain-containing protein [Thermoanaerobacterales bacterium]